MQCPYCRKTLADAPDLAGQMVNCPECGKTFGMSGTATGRPTVRAVPPAVPPTPAPAMEEPPAFRSRGTFRPREYPALRIVILVLYGVAALIFAEFVLGEVAMFSGILRGLAGSPSRVDGKAESGLTLAFFIMQVFWTVPHAAAITLVVGSAESIRVVLDIQHNTQETAFHTRRLA